MVVVKFENLVMCNVWSREVVMKCLVVGERLVVYVGGG